MHLYLNTEQARELSDILGFTAPQFAPGLVATYDTLNFYSPDQPLILTPTYCERGLLNNPIPMHPSPGDMFLTMPDENMQIIIQDEFTGSNRTFLLSRAHYEHINAPLIMIPYRLGPITATVAIELDNDLRVSRMIMITEGQYYQPDLDRARMHLRQAMIEIVPVVTGMLYTWNTRGDEFVFLNPPKPMQVRGEITGISTLSLGPAKHVVNPRDNPTGITRSPHERIGHWRTLASGEQVWIDTMIVHKEDFIPGVHNVKVLK